MSDEPDFDATTGLVFSARERDLGGFSVGRVLPYTRRRMASSHSTKLTHTRSPRLP